jgi:hypothetical protein
MTYRTMPANRLSDRKFGFLFAAVFGLIAVVFWLANGSYQLWAIELGLAFFVVALVLPTLLLPLNRLWEQLGHRLGLVSNFVILGTFFYIVITPFGLVMRLLGNDPMHRRHQPTANSYFTTVQRQATSSTFADMF